MTGVSGIARIDRWHGGGLEAADDIIAGEVAVAITYNRQPHVVMMATPSDLEDFGRGFSLTEGIVSSVDELASVRAIPRDDGIELAMTLGRQAMARVDELRRNLTGRTGCGLCGAETLEQAMRTPPAVGQGLQVSHDGLQRAIEGLSVHQPLQAATGAVHCAALCSAAGEILAAREDVGRHNALDKLIGHLAVSAVDAAEGFILVSSRASYEMVYKSAVAGAQLMAAVSAPTTLAVAFARHCGMTLVGFSRRGRHNVYTSPERLEARAASPDRDA